MTSLSAAAENHPLGLFAGQSSIGNPRLPGSAAFDAGSETYTITGAGANMWLGRDEFQMAWKKMRGDFILCARVSFPDKGVDPHRKMGWIIRTSLDEGSAYVDAAVHGDGLTCMQFRHRPGEDTGSIDSTITAPDVVQLSRRGNTVTLSAARFGEPFTSMELPDIALGDEVYVGIFVCSHNPDVVETGVFSDVRISVPAREDFVPYTDYIGGNLEILEVATGARRIVCHSARSLQAPNWTPDGKALIYNEDGLVYRFDLETGKSSVLNTDFATQNNNDHVLSFDGRMLGISHHSKDHDGDSIVYVLPVEGGIPRQVTSMGPSFLHGWTPDGKELIYTGGRGGNWDIYKIPAVGGEEVRLTSAPGLSDGSEFAPDGKYIYFHSSRGGTMQIWRMRPDGSDQEQVTDDGFNNWFPHISPDGKRMVFLTYLPDVDPGEHPWYKQVYIRMMSIKGGAPKVLAYVYGGQGTINVPSWSPDGTRVAFASYTD